MYNIKQQGDTVQNGIIEYVADTREDIKEIPTNLGQQGSTCLVIEDSSVWILGSDKKWHEL